MRSTAGAAVPHDVHKNEIFEFGTGKSACATKTKFKPPKRVAFFIWRQR
jgi:hypothetical protein